MIFFGDAQNKSLSEALATRLSFPLFYPEVIVFPDGERRVRLTQNVVGKDVVFVKTSSVTQNVDSFIIETTFLIDAIKRSGAKKITGIIPYIPYSRADHVFHDGEAVPLEVVIHLLEKSGLSQIVFVDPHTHKMCEMFAIGVVNLSALSLFAEKIEEIGFDKNCVLVTPDMGGLARVKKLSEFLGNVPYVVLKKERDHVSGKVKVLGTTGKVTDTCFVIDDMISSGGTIVKAVDELTKQGAKRIYVLATHGIFSENATHILQNAKTEKVIVTDSIPVPKEKQFKKLEVVSLAPLLAKALAG